MKEKYPKEYQLYDQHIGVAQIRASAGGSSNGSSGSGGIAMGSSPQFNKRSSRNRNISVMENGKRISINEDDSGITVAINEKRVHGKNVAELKEKYPEAFRIYEKHMRPKRNDGPLDATTLMQEQLRKLRNQNANNPRMKNLIDKMIRNSGQ